MSRFITLMVAVFIATTAHAASFDANVACVQSYTAALGYYPGAVDGIDGPGTQGAITKAAAVLGLKGPYLASFVCEDLANLAAQKNGDPHLLVYTDLPQDSSILKQIVSGYQAARKLLKDADVPATLYVFQRQEALVATSGMSRQWDFALAITQGTKTYFQASRTPGVYQPWPEVAAHEYFQVHHNVLAGRNFEAREDRVPVDGAAWLVEGAAELAGFLALGDTGEKMWGPERQLAAVRPGILAGMETQAGFNATPHFNQTAHSAVEYLAKVTSRDKVLTQYWKARGAVKIPTDEDWKVTFEKVFGISVANFYAAYEKGASPQTLVIGKVE